MWLNWYISQWDLFIDDIKLRNEQIDNEEFLIKLLYFKQADDKSYHHYRQITQLVDLISLDMRHLVFDNRQIIAGCILLVLYKSLDINPSESQQLIEEESLVKSTFKDFLHKSFNYTMEEIQESFEYVLLYSELLQHVSIDLPLTIQMAAEDDVEINNVSLNIIFQ